MLHYLNRSTQQTGQTASRYPLISPEPFRIVPQIAVRAAALICDAMRIVNTPVIITFIIEAKNIYKLHLELLEQDMFSFLVSYQRLGLSVDWRYLKPVNFFHHFGEALQKRYNR